MKKYKAYIDQYGWERANYYPIIILSPQMIIRSAEHQYYLSRRSAKRAAERVAKKLNIGLIWEK